jgi:hypothetical protein
MANYNWNKITEERMAAPRAGDRFTEFYAFWVHVVYVDNDRIIVEEYNAPCELIKDRKLKKFSSLRDFQKEYAYGTIPGYPLVWVAGDAPTEHITKEDITIAADTEELEDASDFIMDGE